MIEFICKECGNKFLGYPSDKSKYCSRVCKSLSQIGKPTWNKGTKGICKPNSGSFKKGKNTGKNNTNWKGGKIIDKNGYILIFKPNHINSNSLGYIREHRLIVEKHINRYLTKKETIHHINGIKTDNRPENLYLFETTGDHTSFEKSENKQSLVSNIINSSSH